VDVHGWEIEAQASHTFSNGFNVWASHSWAFAKDKIIRKADPILKPDYQKLAGYQIDQQRVTLNQGEHRAMNSWNDVYNCVGPTTNLTHLLPGDFMRIDFNCDGVIDANDAVPYGYPARPQYTYAPSLGFSFKNLSANVRFYGVYNVEGGVTDGSGFNPALEDRVISYLMDNSWSIERNNTTNAIYSGQRFQTTGAGGYVDRSRSYIRLESAEIAYSLNNKSVPLIQKAGFENVRFSLSGTNLILWSKMLTDKDYQGESTVDTRYNYPVLKRYNVGVSIDF